jgi:hypothetical protein
LHVPVTACEMACGVQTTHRHLIYRFPLHQARTWRYPDGCVYFPGELCSW